MVFTNRMFDLHVLEEFGLSLAGVSTHLTDKGFCLMTELVAVQLVNAVTTIQALVTLVPERECNTFNKPIFINKRTCL